MHCCTTSTALHYIDVLQCQEECDEGQYGLGCAHQCQCLNGGDCHPVTGECHCAPGWRGEHCGERICEQEELWGLGCNNICTYHQNNTRL